MTLVVVDVEADGPVPGLYSMVCLGAVEVREGLENTFYGETAPLDGAKYDKTALGISGFSRAEHEKFDLAFDTIHHFYAWIQGVEKPVFVSDNLAFDWQWVNYYFHLFVGTNPFGWSGRRIGDIYAGYKGDMKASWKHLRKTKHTHDPVDDAMGNAEALLAMAEHVKGIL